MTQHAGPGADIRLLYVTVPDTPTAKAIAAALVEARLAACVNILGPITSVYRWAGRVEDAREVALIVKTTQAEVAGARAMILRLHPYETPAILAIKVDAQGSLPAFLAWIASQVEQQGGSDAADPS